MGESEKAEYLVGVDLGGTKIYAGVFKPVFPASRKHVGITVGADTLLPEDLFFSMPGPAGMKSVYRYSREWRFDLKEIRFNDSTFAVLRSVDFRGYEKDRNPKYYESLRLVPGRFLSPREITLFVIGHVDPARGYQSVLPDFTDIYTIPENR